VISKPTPLEVLPSHIPIALKETKGWVLWKYELRTEGKWTKPPVNETGERIDAHNPENWMDFSTAYQAYQNGGFDGIGFSLDATPGLVGVDLDHCIEDVKIESWAQEIIDELGGYTEISPSGTGIRVLGYGKLRNPGRKMGNVEMYDGGRYLTVTGHRLEESFPDLVDFDEVINRVHDRMWPEKTEVPHEKRGEGGTRTSIPDKELLAKIRSSKQEDNFNHLWGGGPCGYPSDSEADLAFCNMLAFWCACNEAQMDRIFKNSGRYRPKWDEKRGVQTYGEMTLQKAIDGCSEVYSPSSSDLIEIIMDGLIEDPQKLKDRDVLAALLYIRERDPIGFDILIGEIVANTNATKRSINRALDIEKEKIEAENIENDEELEEEAVRIISEGRSFEYIYQIWQSRHLGDARAGKALLASAGAQSCSNTAGIHVILNGPKGCGKSDVLTKACELIPPKHLLFGDLSPQAIYYHAREMPEGAIIAFDDITWNSTYAGVQKRCTTRFQTGADHRTVIDGKPKSFKTKPRITFWCTSVDRQFDEQLQDRYWAIDIEASAEHKAEVIEFMKACDAGADQESEEYETRICRDIIRDLKDHLFEVVIPFAGRIKLSGVGERGYRIFSDIVKAFCAFRYAVRETDGRGRLIATEEDFLDAKALFDDAEGHGGEKYTDSERKVLEAIIQCGYVATIQNIVEETGLSSGRVRDIINGRGRDEQRRHGLLAKCPALTVESVSESTRFKDVQLSLSEIDMDFRTTKTVRHNEYRLDKGFCLDENYTSQVLLEPVDNVPNVAVT
jgi:primase-polymerase (primpol)-like protein